MEYCQFSWVYYNAHNMKPQALELWLHWLLNCKLFSTQFQGSLVSEPLRLVSEGKWNVQKLCVRGTQLTRTALLNSWATGSSECCKPLEMRRTCFRRSSWCCDLSQSTGVVWELSPHMSAVKWREKQLSLFAGNLCNSCAGKRKYKPWALKKKCHF